MVHYPLALCSHNRILVVPAGWFTGIGRLDVGLRILMINVSQLGTGGLAWFIDAMGVFHNLRWEGLESKTFLQTLGIKRRVERYSIDPARQISVGELAALVEGLIEQFAEAPNSGDLRALLAGRERDELVSRALMREYLGE